MFLNASRNCRVRVAGLAVSSALAALMFAASAGASIIPTPVPPPPGDAALPKWTDLVISATTPTTVSVKNTGNRSAGPFSIAVASGYLDWECGGSRPIPALRRGVSGLGPGQSTTVTIPDASANRAAKVDFLGAVAESNEFNNTGTIPGGPSAAC